MMRQTDTDKAILVVSFGTTHEGTRAVTIDAIEEDLAAAFPGRRLYRAWTSGMILRILKKRACRSPETGDQQAEAGAKPGGDRAGREYPQVPDSVEEALDRMAADGIRDILVQPTHIISGAENEKLKGALEAVRERFERIALGRPLLDRAEDRRRLAGILAEEFLGPGPDREDGPETESEDRADLSAAGREDRILLLMGHGSGKRTEANRIYTDMQETFRDMGYDRAFVATVEGQPTLEEALAAMAEIGSPGEGECPAREKTETDGPAGGKEEAGVPAGGKIGASGPAQAAEAGLRGPVVLAPLMVVAGDHARNDMAGEEEDSWKNRLKTAGYEPFPVLRGLGEYPRVRAMFTDHAREAAAE